MSSTSRKQLASRTATTLGAVLLAFATVTGSAKAQAGPPAVTQGSAKANAKAAKGQAVAESKRVKARNAKASKSADKVADKEEKSAHSAAKTERKALLKRIKLTKTQHSNVAEIEKRYDKQLKDLDDQGKAAEKAGTPDAAFVAKIDALRLQERADLRTALTATQLVQFEKNVLALSAKK